MVIREERPGDEPHIHRLIRAAFVLFPIGERVEHLVIDALHEAGALTLSLVAERKGVVVGQASFSPVTINGQDVNWHALGPVGVLPGFQNLGLGTALVQDGLRRMKERGSRGCVVVGEPRFYGRFGFELSPGLTMNGVPPEYLQALAFEGEIPAGSVAHHPAFSIRLPEGQQAGEGDEVRSVKLGRSFPWLNKGGC